MDLSFNISPIFAAGGQATTGFDKFVDLPTPAFTEESPLLPPQTSDPKQSDKINISSNNITEEPSTCISSLPVSLQATPTHAERSKASNESLQDVAAVNQIQ